MTRGWRRVAWGLLPLLGMLATAQAHQVAATKHRLDIIEQPGHTYRLKWSGERTNLRAVFPPGFEELPAAPDGSRRVRCDRALSGQQVSLEGFDGNKQEVLVRTVLQNGRVQVEILSGDRNAFTILASPTKWQVALTYFKLGVDHILTGTDHLMFVLGLILILSSWRQLALAITAFTVAHSITLALATFKIISVPQPPVEAVIALSIMFLATEYAHQLRGVPGWTSRWPWLVSFSVGLLHGLGFAGALKEVGLPQAEVPMALFTFNVGVEVGQLAFVAVVLSLFFVGRKAMKRQPEWLPVAASYAIGSVAAFWFVQRTVAIFWPAA